MTEKPYLDKDAIVNASELVNTTLISKGYITEKLLFNTIDQNELFTDSIEIPDDHEVKEKIYNNDKNVINILYSLIQSIERNSVQNRTFNKIVAQKDHQMELLKQKLEASEAKVESTERKLAGFQNNDKIKLTNKINELTKTNKILSQDLVRMKNFTSDYQTKYIVQTKKKNLEIQSLRDKLSEKSLNRNNFINNNVNSSEITNYTVVYNNIPSINNQILHEQNQSMSLSEPLKQEYESIMTDLSLYIETLIIENYRFSKFIQLISKYFSQVNINISLFNLDMDNIEIPNPSTIIDFEGLQSNVPLNVGLREANDDLESFDSVAKPLMNNVYKNFHYTLDLVDSIKQQNNEDPKIIKGLEDELAIVKKNWQDAITTLENWKKFKE